MSAPGIGAVLRGLHTTWSAHLATAEGFDRVQVVPGRPRKWPASREDLVLVGFVADGQPGVTEVDTSDQRVGSENRVLDIMSLVDVYRPNAELYDVADRADAVAAALTAALDVDRDLGVEQVTDARVTQLTQALDWSKDGPRAWMIVTVRVHTWRYFDD